MPKSSRPSKDSDGYQPIQSLGAHSKALSAEAESMHKLIRYLLAVKDRAIVAVVGSDDCKSELGGICEEMDTKNMQQKSNSIVRVTTPDHLSNRIKRIDTNKDHTHRDMVLLVHGTVQSIPSFNLSSRHTSKLTILQCPRAGGGGPPLLVNGTSTFGGLQLGDLVARPPDKKRTLLLGQGGTVSIQGDLNRMQTWGNNGPPPRWESEVKANAEGLDEFLGGSEAKYTGDGWWQHWKSSVATVLGILSGSAKAAAGLTVNAGGFYFKYAGMSALGSHTVQIGAAGGTLKATTMAAMTAAGPAILTGAVVAAAVYFVPWSDFFSWVRKSFFPKVLDILKRIYNGIMSAWIRFKEWVTEKFSTSTTGMKPMAFAA